MEVHMGKYENYNDSVVTGFGVAAFVALAVLLFVAYSTGYLEIRPYEGNKSVTDLPITPTLVPALPPVQPKS